MSRQFTQKSFLFLLIILAAAAVVFFLVWNGMEEFNQVEAPNSNPLDKEASIESTSAALYDSELEQELKSFDNDSADLVNLQNDPSINNVDQDLANLFK